MYTSKEFQVATDARMHLAAIMTAIETAPDDGVRYELALVLRGALNDLKRETNLLHEKLRVEQAFEAAL